MSFRQHPVLPASLPHLKGAMNLTGPRGLCFHRAVGLVLDLGPPVPAELVFGRIREATKEEAEAIGPDASPQPFVHAWVEWRGAIWAPTIIEAAGGLFPVDREVYMERNGARELARMKRGAVTRLDRIHGFSAHLRKFKPLKNDASFGQVLLDAAGIEWCDNGLGGVMLKEDLQ